jgi:hypothetical protein
MNLNKICMNCGAWHWKTITPVHQVMWCTLVEQPCHHAQQICIPARGRNYENVQHPCQNHNAHNTKYTI